ncbi:unnamed protein product [Brassicogethes aeneus]|uniref:PH domain-containing protein n=1 Tax=Brassicogethes aeneus TaxID=1431903 RepID=A0A9P0B9Y9_BRAAE|nr:unnamed protein product [Brassicogethes aeneus]
MEEIKPKMFEEPLKSKEKQDQMTSSTISSLASPGDSGVQMLDSESELTSVMSSSGYGCEIEDDKKKVIYEEFPKNKDVLKIEKGEVMTKSDIANQNITHDYSNMSVSVPNYFDKFDLSSGLSHDKINNKNDENDVFEMDHPIKSTDKPEDIMNCSLNSYELLDYTMANLTIDNTDQMHVSMSEEVNETLKTEISSISPVPEVPENIPIVSPEEKPVEEQIVFRRQRKKKNKSDTPKKRVSFHEDILNSTKIDDIHINHGFITIEPDVSLSFFQRGFIKKADVVKGRYSWAAEGDAPYYEKPSEDREIKSAIYMQNNRYSSTSSSSTGSTSSSIDEEETNSDENVAKMLEKKPKSSCLKKTKKKFIDTKIVQEETTTTKKKSEDINIFGSLKNILNFSTSVPLAERGVPEGQEDITVYSSSQDISGRRKSFGSLSLKNFETIEIKPPPIINKVTEAKNNLKFAKSEGFYPNYPTNQNLPSNIIICDSNVYEHKGISYSYEYDKFQKSFEQQNKPKSSTIYQTILKEFNFFKRKAKNSKPEEDFEFINSKADSVEEPEVGPIKPKPNKHSINSKMDWSDNDTNSDYSEATSRHLHSPKRRTLKNNHYSLQNTLLEEDLRTLRASSSKSSLINRFLKNVTQKKMMDLKAEKKTERKIMSLYVKNFKGKMEKNDDLDGEIAREIVDGKNKTFGENFDGKLVFQFKKEIFRSCFEKLIKVFGVRSAYTTKGESQMLSVILTDKTLYIAGLRPNNTYCNYFVLPYTELNTILIGPNAQTIHFANYDRDMQCVVTTGCSILTGELVGQLEMRMRRDPDRPQLPAVKQLSMRDMANLRRAICKQTSVHKDEEYFYYSIVNIQEFNPDEQEINTPMGPSKEGPLMFKSYDGSRWETAYFILKAGVLYMLSSASQRVPMRVFPLINGSCQGARRVFNGHRPHTFQLIVEGKSLLLAAPDEYVASEWLQQLVHSASGTYNREKSTTQSCSLLMTGDHILTVREAFPLTINTLLPRGVGGHEPIKGAQALSCAAICDLTSFRLPSAEQSWCILEFACREVHECSGDWILYFSTNAELEKFISTLEMLWAYNNEGGECFPLSTIPETDPLSKRCVDVYTSLISTWPSDTVHLQFL